jgi:hypothetical protein
MCTAKHPLFGSFSIFDMTYTEHAKNRLIQAT